VHKCALLALTALDLAAGNGYLDFAKVLIAAGADVHHADNDGATCLHMAVLQHQSTMVQLLLEHGAAAAMNSLVPVLCINGVHCCHGITALMLCTEVNTMKVLLAAGADVHVISAKGDTCLHAAVRHKAPVPVLCLLIKAGVDLYMQ
jgi:ankyrin repeat protein